MNKPHSNVHKIFTNHLPFRKKNNENKNNKNNFNKNGGRFQDIKTQKACKQGWEVNVRPIIKQTTYNS